MPGASGGETRRVISRRRSTRGGRVHELDHCEIVEPAFPEPEVQEVIDDEVRHIEEGPREGELVEPLISALIKEPADHRLLSARYFARRDAEHLGLCEGSFDHVRFEECRVEVDQVFILVGIAEYKLDIREIDRLFVSLRIVSPVEYFEIVNGILHRECNALVVDKPARVYLARALAFRRGECRHIRDLGAAGGDFGEKVGDDRIVHIVHFGGLHLPEQIADKFIEALLAGDCHREDARGIA